jgi:hypothetical protein
MVQMYEKELPAEMTPEAFAVEAAEIAAKCEEHKAVMISFSWNGRQPVVRVHRKADA